MLDRLIQRLTGGLLAVPLVLGSYLILLWNMSVPMTGDQKVYLSIALEMRERGEWIIPYLFERANFLKPPLQYWATLLGWKVFGFGLFGALIPSVLAMIGAGWVVRRISGEGSFLPLVFFCATIASMTYGTTAQMEIWIVLFYPLSWMLWRERRENLAWISTGVMALVKGPLYPALWVISVSAQKGFQKQTRELLRPRFIGGLALGILIGLSWYFLAARTHLQAMLDQFLLRENVGKLSTSQGSPLGLWSEFLGTTFPLLPWWVFSVASKEFRARWRENRGFWLAYGLIPAVFFTLFPYRVNTYLYILTPLFVWMLSIQPPSVPRALRLPVQSLVAMVAGVMLFLILRLVLGAWIGAWIFALSVVALAIWVISIFRMNPALVGLGALLLVTTVRLAAIEIGERDIRGLREYRAANSGQLAYFLDGEDIWHEFGLISSALGEPILRIRGPEEKASWLAGGNALILSNEQESEATGLSCTEWRRLKRRMKFPLRELILQGLSIEDPALHRVFRLCRTPGPATSAPECGRLPCTSQ